MPHRAAQEDDPQNAIPLVPRGKGNQQGGQEPRVCLGKTAARPRKPWVFLPPVTCGCARCLTSDRRRFEGTKYWGEQLMNTLLAPECLCSYCAAIETGRKPGANWAEAGRTLKRLVLGIGVIGLTKPLFWIPNPGSQGRILPNALCFYWTYASSDPPGFTGLHPRPTPHLPKSISIGTRIWGAAGWQCFSVVDKFWCPRISFKTKASWPVASAIIVAYVWRKECEVTFRLS